MKWHGVAHDVWRSGAPPPGMLSGPNGRLVASECVNCARFSVWIAEITTLPTGLERLNSSTMVYPNVPSIEAASVHMPARVQALYDEAARVLGPSPRSAAALLRLALEQLCDELGAQGANLNGKIGWLVQDRGLSATVRNAMDIVRVIGNNAVHPGQIVLDEDPGLVPSMFRLLNVVVEQLIETPQHVQQLWDGLPAHARAAVDRRDGTS